MPALPSSILRTALGLGISLLLSACSALNKPDVALSGAPKLAFYPACEARIDYLQSAATGMNGPNGNGLPKGGAAGYYREKQKQIEDPLQRIGAYADEIHASTATINRNAGYAHAAFTCFQRQFETLVSAGQGSTLNPSQGRQRMAQIVAGLQRTASLFALVDERSQATLDRYRSVYVRDLQLMGKERAEVIAVLAATTSERPKRTKRGKSILPEELLNTERTLQQAGARQQLAEEALQLGERLLGDICSHPAIDDWAPPSCAQVPLT